MKRCLISLLLVLCLTISGLSFAAAEEKPSGTLEFWSFLTQEVRAKELLAVDLAGRHLLVKCDVDRTRLLGTNGVRAHVEAKASHAPFPIFLEA